MIYYSHLLLTFSSLSEERKFETVKEKHKKRKLPKSYQIKEEIINEMKQNPRITTQSLIDITGK